MSDQQDTFLGPSELECNFVNGALPLPDVHFLPFVLRGPEYQMRRVPSGRRGQRPRSLVVWTDSRGAPNHGRQSLFELVQVLDGNQNNEVRDFSDTVRMFYASDGDLETPPLAHTDSESHHRHP